MAERGRGKKQSYDKNSQANREWQAKKREGRPHQQFNPETKTWGKIMEPKKVTQ